MPNTRFQISIVIAFLTLSILAVFWQVRHFDFVRFDDHLFLVENTIIHKGITYDNLLWSFGFHLDYWKPLTWLSHMLDFQLFGMHPGMHHLTNLALHAINSILLLLFLNAATQDLKKSLLIATLFALHPLAVDSAAWVSERKNLLSSTFWMLTLLTYAFYAKRPSLHAYGVMILFFMCGLMAKPMLITLPCVMLLLDFWPLRRFAKPAGRWTMFIPAETPANQLSPVRFHVRNAIPLIVEKIPFFMLAVVCIFISTSSNRHHGWFVPFELRPMEIRLSNAMLSYFAYIGKIVWPFDLMHFYPFPEAIPPWQGWLAGILLVLLCVLVFRFAKSRPFLFVGWFWFLGTLVPVIGIVQNGLWPKIADRWLYMPGIGIYIVIAWTIPAMTGGRLFRRAVDNLIPAGIILIFMINSYIQAGHWRNTIALITHSLEVDPKEAHMKYNNMGAYLHRQGRLDEAIEQYRIALSINPDFAGAHCNIAVALREKGDLDGAGRHFLRALEINPDNEILQYNFGLLLEKLGKPNNAARQYQFALQVKPDFKPAYFRLAYLLVGKGKYQTAEQLYHKILQIDPADQEALFNLGAIAKKTGNTEKAIAFFQKVLKLNPGHADARKQLDSLVQKQ